MSQTFSLVCHETRKRILIGQGWGKFTSFYTGDKDTMAKLKSFLQAHEGKDIVLIRDYDEWDKTDI